MGRREKPKTVVELNRHLCGAICLCQLTVVLSSVSLIYLSVAVYMPSHRAFHSGFDPQPVMCQTVHTSNVNNCNWASCGEWCLTKTTGFCPQMHVTVRQNATDLLLNNCTSLNNVSCPPADPLSVKRYNCNQGSECDNLHGVFNCSLGHCGNYSERFLCHYKADGVILNTEKDNMKLNGFFECRKSLCTKIKRPFSCDRYCNKITTTSMNVFLMHEDNLFTGECREAFALNRANGNAPGEPVNATEVWHEEKSGGALLASCLSVVRVGNSSLRATDCLNGTVLPERLIPQPFINFTTFWALYGNSSQPLDPAGHFLPPQSALTIYNSTRLYINLEGCVNTLRGECRDFLTTHGRDGANQTAQSRFPCYYNPDDNFMAVARFDLGKTLRELLIATLVPSVLFVVSFVTLVIITKFVRVRDDGKMKCTLCCGDDVVLQDADGGPGPESRLMNSGKRPKRASARGIGREDGHEDSVQDASAREPRDVDLDLIVDTPQSDSGDGGDLTLPYRLSVSAPPSAGSVRRSSSRSSRSSRHNADEAQPAATPEATPTAPEGDVGLTAESEAGTMAPSEGPYPPTRAEHTEQAAAALEVRATPAAPPRTAPTEESGEVSAQDTMPLDGSGARTAEADAADALAEALAQARQIGDSAAGAALDASLDAAAARGLAEATESEKLVPTTEDVAAQRAQRLRSEAEVSARTGLHPRDASDSA